MVNPFVQVTDFVTDCTSGDRVLWISIYGYDSFIF